MMRAPSPRHRSWVLPEEAYGAEIEFKTETFDQGRAAAWGTSGYSDAQETGKSLSKWE